MNRKKLVAGNWKMNTLFKDALALGSTIIDDVRENDVEVVLIPPAPFIRTIAQLKKHNQSTLYIGAQDCSDREVGAYTGEISAAMLESVGVTYVVVGHSERRQYFNEGSAVLLEKTKRVLESGMKVIFCCGEPLEIRERNEHVAYVQKQLQETILQLSEEEMKRVVVAYEPIWAIGTGKTAGPEQAQEMHAAIRSLITRHFSTDLGQEVVILYGGSVKPGNAHDLFKQPDVDGGLVGGASLNPDTFISIIRSF